MSVGTKYRGVIIGCGNIGALLERDERRPRPRTHASTLITNPKTELSAFVDTSGENLKKAGMLFPDVPAYTDLQKCLAEKKPDITIVATSPVSHAPIIEVCADAKVSILIGEKPIAHSMEDAYRIKSAIEKSNSIFVLNYQRRFFPLFLRARKRLAAGALGRIREVRCLYDNGLFNNGGHAIDSAQFLLGGKMLSVTGVVNEKNTTHPEGDSNIEGAVLAESGTKISLQSFDQKVSPVHELQLYGEKGELHIRDFGYTFDWGDSVEHEEVSMTAGALDEAIGAYEENREPVSGIQNGIETLSVLEALSESARQNGIPQKVIYTR